MKSKGYLWGNPLDLLAIAGGIVVALFIFNNLAAPLNFSRGQILVTGTVDLQEEHEKTVKDLAGCERQLNRMQEDNSVLELENKIVDRAYGVSPVWVVILGMALLFTWANIVIHWSTKKENKKEEDDAS